MWGRTRKKNGFTDSQRLRSPEFPQLLKFTTLRETGGADGSLAGGREKKTILKAVGNN